MTTKRKKAAATTASEKVLILRTCAADLTLYGGFKWPESGPVECPDWNPEPRCGGGLHGLLWGVGDGSILNYSPDAKWLVVEVEAKSLVRIEDDKVKFRRGVVVHCGDRRSATDYLLARGAAGKPVVGATCVAGRWGTATAGYGGTATAGDWGTATAGDWGTATAGRWGTATAGYWGTATAGDWGTATAGYGGTATVGHGGILVVRWWDGSRCRLAVGYVGEDGIEPNIPYKVIDGRLGRA